MLFTDKQWAAGPEMWCMVYQSFNDGNSNTNTALSTRSSELERHWPDKRLQLQRHTSVTSVMWLGSSQQLDKINIRDVPLLSAMQRNGRQHSSCPWRHILDSHCRWTRTLLLSAGAVTTNWSSFVQSHDHCLLRQLRHCPGICIQPTIDYCNAMILHGLPLQKLMRHLQSVQNAATQMITSARRRDHITPILRQLHWLPVRQRVDFKIAVLSWTI